MAKGSSSTTALDDGAQLVVVRHPGWLVGFRLVQVPGTAGVWQMTEMAARYLGTGTTTVADLRALPLGDLLAQARQRAGQRPIGGKLLRPSEVHLLPFMTERRRGTARPDEDYAHLAFVYVDLLERGITTPAKHLADNYGHGSAALWANRLSEARRRGLLTQVGTTTAGGELTAKAWGLLGFREGDDDEIDRYIAEMEDRSD